MERYGGHRERGGAARRQRRRTGWKENPFPDKPSFEKRETCATASRSPPFSDPSEESLNSLTKTVVCASNCNLVKQSYLGV